MTARTLPRSSRGRALPRCDTDAVQWPPALRGSSPLVVLTLLGWLGGGLVATAVALVTSGQNDLAYGLVNTAAACTGLLLLALAVRVSQRRTRPDAPARPGEPVPVRVPVQAERQLDDRREPALP